MRWRFQVLFPDGTTGANFIAVGQAVARQVEDVLSSIGCSYLMERVA